MAKSQTHIDFWNLLPEVQEAMAKNYSETLADESRHKALKPYIEQYLREKGYIVNGLTLNQAINRLYREMVEYSILTPFLANTELEEININAWNDIAITDLDGNITKTREHFHSPQHAIDIIKKLLHHSGMVIDDSTPMAQGHLPNNIRITALKEPLVDPDVGIAVSIRILHPQRVNYESLIRWGTATQEMMEFLALCARYGVSFVVAGATSSGKTTAMNAILNTIPDNKRIYTIETGARELHLVHKDEKGKIINNVVHTLSRPTDKKETNIDQAQLVVGSLRFNPDNIVVGEIRDAEAHDAVEASLTGHTVITSIHATAAKSAHMRMALLCQRKPNAPTFEQSMLEAAQAFPIVVYAHKLENNARKIMDIAECITDDTTGERTYRSLYKYIVTKNEAVGDDYIIEGYFTKVNTISPALKQKLLNFGCPNTKLKKFINPFMSQNDSDYPPAPIATEEELEKIMMEEQKKKNEIFEEDIHTVRDDNTMIDEADDISLNIVGGQDSVLLSVNDDSLPPIEDTSEEDVGPDDFASVAQEAESVKEVVSDSDDADDLSDDIMSQKSSEVQPEKDLVVDLNKEESEQDNNNIDDIAIVEAEPSVDNIDILPVASVDDSSIPTIEMPKDIVSDVIGDVVDPVPVVEQVIAPVEEQVIEPVEEQVIEPVVEQVVAPVVENFIPVLDIAETSKERHIASDDDDIVQEAAVQDVQPDTVKPVTSSPVVVESNADDVIAQDASDIQDIDISDDNSVDISVNTNDDTNDDSNDYDLDSDTKINNNTSLGNLVVPFDSDEDDESDNSSDENIVLLKETSLKENSVKPESNASPSFLFSNIKSEKRQKKEKKEKKPFKKDSSSDTSAASLFSRAFGKQQPENSNKNTVKSDIKSPEDTVKPHVNKSEDVVAPHINKSEDIVEPNVKTVKDTPVVDSKRTDVSEYTEKSKTTEPVDLETYKQNLAKYTEDDIKNMSFSDILKLLNK